MDTMLRLGIRYILTIGGDDTAIAALEVARAADGAMLVAHAPKAINSVVGEP